MKCENLGNHMISHQSLLLSTTVLNDVPATVQDLKISLQFVSRLVIVISTLDM